MTSWRYIHPDFAKKTMSCDYQREWENLGISYEEAQKWVGIGFSPNDYAQIKGWKNQNFDLQTTELWIKIGFELSEAQKAKEWKDLSFNHQQAVEWIKLGLKSNDAEFAAYLKWKSYLPQSTLDLEQLRKEFEIWSKESKPAQDYIDIFYLKEIRSSVKNLSIGEKGLTNSLDLNDFSNLTDLRCSNNELTTLDLTNCSSLKEIICSDNLLAEIKLPKEGDKLQKLHLKSNNFSRQDLSFLSYLTNIKSLQIGNDNQEKIEKNIYNRFEGSLKPLQEMSDLEELNISNTDIDRGIEYWSKSTSGNSTHSPLGNSERFFCLSNKRKDAKCKSIYNLFANERDANGRQLIYSSLFSDNEREKVKKRAYSGIEQFSQKLQAYKEWRKNNFTEEEIKEWLNAGATIEGYSFFSWLRNVKGHSSNWVTNYKEDCEVLMNRFKKYGVCAECNQPNTGDQWCRSCNSKRLQENFVTWASGNLEIDQFIQKYQLEATDKDKFLEWIPYKQFINSKYLAEGGFGKVYKAEWVEGNIQYWDIKNKKWKREKDYYWKNKNKWNEKKEEKNHKIIVLKSLNNSRSNTEFLQEIANHKIIDDWFNNTVPCYGISQEPKTGNYLIVMKYISGGSLCHYLSDKMQELNLEDKFRQLISIVQGLKDAHQKNLVHRDLHLGNILKGVEKNSCLITDLGLCKPVGETNKEKEIYGVLPYVAPEVLRVKGYTLASDIYSLGIVAYEIFANQSPYLDREHDILLSVEICQGYRPNIDKVPLPQLLKDLIKRCWDDNPQKRLTVNDLHKEMNTWLSEIKSKSLNTEFYRQYQAIEKEYNQISQNSTYKSHPTAIMTSKKIDTKQITERLKNIGYSQSLENSEKIIVKSQEQILLESEEIPPVQIQKSTNWQNLHPTFTPELITQWTNFNFTLSQVKEWINIGLTPTDSHFASYLHHQLHLTPEDVLNHHNYQELQAEFQAHQLHSHQLQPPK